MASSPDPDKQTTARRLGQQLKRVRLAAGHATQAAFATRIRYGEDAVSKTETGTVPSRQLFTRWLEACKDSLTDGETAALTALWESAREGRGPIPEFFELYLSREKDAVFLRLWMLNILSGVLQVHEYAYAMFIAVGYDEDEATELANARIQRRAALEGPDAKQVTATIYEPVLYAQVGTPEVMIKQLEDLLKVSRRPNVVVQVVRDTGYFVGRRGQFELASGPGIPDTLVMLNLEDQTQDSHALAAKSAAVFERIRAYALPLEESQALIRKALEHWKSQQQQ